MVKPSLANGLGGKISPIMPSKATGYGPPTISARKGRMPVSVPYDRPGAFWPIAAVYAWDLAIKFPQESGGWSLVTSTKRRIRWGSTMFGGCWEIKTTS